MLPKHVYAHGPGLLLTWVREALWAVNSPADRCLPDQSAENKAECGVNDWVKAALHARHGYFTHELPAALVTTQLG